MIKIPKHIPKRKARRKNLIDFFSAKHLQAYRYIICWKISQDRMAASIKIVFMFR